MPHDLVPWLGNEPRSQQWKCKILTTRPPGNSLTTAFNNSFFLGFHVPGSSSYNTASSFSVSFEWSSSDSCILKRCSSSVSCCRPSSLVSLSDSTADASTLRASTMSPHIQIYFQIYVCSLDHVNTLLLLASYLPSVSIKIFPGHLKPNLGKTTLNIIFTVFLLWFLLKVKFT